MIGLFHYVFRKKFLAISMNQRLPRHRAFPVRLWDFLFYASLDLW